jgi:ribosome-binding factor A
MDDRRRSRVSGDIRQALMEVISRDTSDPRLGSILVTRVKVSRDGSHATVFYETAGTGEEREAAVAAVDSATSYLRRNMAPMLSLRTVPALSFVHDLSGEQGDRVLGIMRELDDDV